MLQLNKEQIEKLLSEKNCPLQIRCTEETDSTNEWAKREKLSDTEMKSGIVYLADHQTAGKGRRGHIWESPRGTSVSMSICIHPDLAPDRLAMLTLVMGMAAADGIRDVTGIAAGIKWPNDVVYEGRKLCGILTEYDALTGNVIIGIGLNINMETFPDELKDVAASLYMITGKTEDRESVTASVIGRFWEYYQMFCETGDLQKLKPAYERILVNRRRIVQVMDAKEPFRGRAEGITNTGELIITREDTGETVTVYSGEVSVRGIYGYV